MLVEAMIMANRVFYIEKQKVGKFICGKTDATKQLESQPPTQQKQKEKTYTIDEIEQICKLTSLSDNPLSPSLKRKRAEPLVEKEEDEENLVDRSTISMFFKKNSKNFL